MRDLGSRTQTSIVPALVAALLGGCLAGEIPDGAEPAEELASAEHALIDDDPDEDSGGGGGGPLPSCKYTGARPPYYKGTLRARLRLLSHNIYGLDKESCSSRALRLGQVIAAASPPYDFVGVQEHYATFDANLFTCDDHWFTDGIWSTGRYTNDDNYYRFYPIGEWWQAEVDGGTSIFTVHPIKVFKEWEWKNSGKQLHGFVFSRIKIPGTYVWADVYTVHLQAGVDGCDRACRRGELAQLKNAIHENSAASGNPVIVMGDFNIGGPPSCNGNAGYGDIMVELGNPRDLWLEAHPTKSGFTMDCGNPLNDCTNSARIDFIFLLTDPWLTNTPYDLHLASADSVKLVKVQTASGKPVSDHYGLEATIEVRDRVTGATPIGGLSP